MAKKVSAAEARSHLSSLAAEAGRGGRHVIIERRGQPVAALVSIEELAVLQQQRTRPARGSCAHPNPHPVQDEPRP